MDEKRKYYEQRSEVLVKKMLSKIYELEAKALEAKMNTSEDLKDLSSQITELKNHREKLQEKYSQMLNASEEKWDEIATQFENYLEEIRPDKSEFYNRAQNWLNDFSKKISDLEDKAKKSNDDMRQKIMQQVNQLKDQKNKMQQTLSEMHDERDETWHNIKEGIDDGLTTMKTSINKLYQQFKKSDGK